ncbi:MAG TPA: methionine adenosyltransferase [Bacteroidales bacterium]|nr:methionine adenosyltransferase [Bacteroidales bacterium]
MGYLFTSESVSEGHPDKVADQISDALLDEFLRRDPDSKVACETLVTTGLVVLSGEVKTNAYVDVQEIARRVIKRIGYTRPKYRFDSESCGVISTIHEQSPDINQGVVRESEEEQGAGDQGMMFGYANKETDDYMPLALVLSHVLLQELAKVRREGREMHYLRPDSKSQVTIEYNDQNEPVKIHTIVVSTQHDEFAEEDKMIETIKKDVKNILIPRAKARFPERVQKLFNEDIILHVNPTGKFVIGGPHGDTGLTGRKIIVDTYGGKGAHGGGAFSGKDSSKVDRSAAYAARHIAKNLVAAGVAEEALIQVAYAIGVAEPVGLYVNTFNTANVNMNDGEIAEKIKNLFDMRPAAIVKRLGLKYPVFEETAAYGHMGRDFKKEKVTLIEGSNGCNEHTYEKEVEFFAWEKLDYVDKIKAAFNL